MLPRGSHFQARMDSQSGGRLLEGSGKSISFARQTAEVEKREEERVDR